VCACGVTVVGLQSKQSRVDIPISYYGTLRRDRQSAGGYRQREYPPSSFSRVQKASGVSNFNVDRQRRRGIVI